MMHKKLFSHICWRNLCKARADYDKREKSGFDYFMQNNHIIERNINMKGILISIVIVFFILVVLIIVYLWRQNRNSELLNEKIMSAIGVALFGILTALLFSLKSEYKELKFASTLFFHKFDKKPLDDYLQGDGGLRFGGFQFCGHLSQFISKQLEDEDLKKAEFNKDQETIIDFYHNMIIVKLIDQLFWMYSARWDTNVFSVRRGTGELKESYVDTEEAQPDYERLIWTDLLNIEQQNSFLQILSAFSNFTNIKETKFPPKTKVNFIIKKWNKEIILKNPFVEINITINLTGGSSGLGDYRWLLYYENRKSEEFWSTHFRINCNAKFAQLKFGHPDMPKYKQWVEVMFAEIQYLLDEKEQLKRAHEYRDLVKK